MGNVRRPSKRHEVTSRQPACRVRLRVLWCEVRCEAVVDVGVCKNDAETRENAAVC